MSVLDQLICPLDQSPLRLDGNSLRCAQGHSFDRAKTGYVNLLPVQRKQSKDPGDSKPMVAARRAFLDAGHYQPLATALVDQLLALHPEPAALAVLDAGCGEGYYLQQLHQRLTAASYPCRAQGLDISKWAIQAASKRSEAIGWLVGSNAALPMPAASFDLVLCLFGFPVFAEIARVLRPGGVLLMVDGGPNHLRALRQILYPSLRPHRDRYVGGIEGFSLMQEQRLQFAFQLDSNAMVNNLLAMTPHLHKAPYQGRQQAQALEQLDDQADMLLRWYRLD